MSGRKLFIAGLFLGLVGGLIYALLLNPARYTNAYPALLPAGQRADWIRMTAFAYGYDGDEVRAKVRLAHLPEAEVQSGLAEALDEAVAQGIESAALKRMAALAKRYGVENPTVAIYTRPALAPTPSEPSPTPTTAPLPTATATAPSLSPPAATPVITLSLLPTPPSPTFPYLINQTVQGCAIQPRIAITFTKWVTVGVGRYAHLEAEGIPGLTLWLLWDGGADRAVTGFSPRGGLGYADFGVEGGHTYNLYLESPTGVPFLTLAVTPCTLSEGSEGWTTWQVQVVKSGLLPTPTPTPTPLSTPTFALSVTPIATLIPTATYPLTPTPTLTSASP